MTISTSAEFPTYSVIDQRLESLKLKLPIPGAPAAAYDMAVISGHTVFLSGHIAKKDGQIWVGKLGLNLDTASGKLAAASITLDLLATLKLHLGSLDRIKRIVKVMGLINSTDTFVEQHLVMNGCSELLVEIFGDIGRHARSAFGVSQIPLGSCVEIEMIVEIIS